MSTPSDPSNDAVRIDRGKLLKRSAAIALGTSLYSFGDPLTVLAAQMTPKALKPDVHKELLGVFSKMKSS